jgi:hypothetical protein
MGAAMEERQATDTLTARDLIILTTWTGLFAYMVVGALML